jgi:hypothetical protein
MFEPLRRIAEYVKFFANFRITGTWDPERETMESGR